MVRTAERQFESNFLGRRDGEELKRTRAQTRALNQEAAGLVSMIEPDQGSKIIHELLVVQEVIRKPEELPMCLVREAEPEPVSCHAACSPQCSDVWMEAMRIECDGLVATGTFAEMNEIPQGCDIVGVKWLYEWKGEFAWLTGRKPVWYSQVGGVDYFEICAPTTSSTSNGLVAAMACKLD